MNFFKKWYTYQKERFPVIVYGSYILSIVIAVFCFCNYLSPNLYEIILEKTQNASVGPKVYTLNYYKLIPMFIVAFLQFLMVRIIDEFKDYEEDCKYRPYRPVPRGLITLKELKVLFIICIALQIIVTILASPESIPFLIIVWIVFALMSKGFFIKKFLDKHMLIEVLFDELLMPALVLYLAHFVYYVDYQNIWKLLIMSYVISWIVEIARKVRCKDDEEKGVRTYTAVFGIKAAMLILTIVETILMISNLFILGTKYLIACIAIYGIVILCNILFSIIKNRKLAKLTELSANLYIMFCYLSLILLII